MYSEWISRKNKGLSLIFITLHDIKELSVYWTVYWISKTQDPNYGYARYCAVIYNGATNHVCIEKTIIRK